MINKYNKDIVLLIANILKSRILLYKDIDKILYDVMNLQCDYMPCQNENKNDVDFIFKLYLFYGKVADIVRITRKNYNQITDILVCGKSKDIILTLLVKAMYSLTNSKYSDFLKIQVDLIIKNHDIDIRQTYIDYLLTDCNEEEIKEHLKQFEYLF